MGEVADKPWSQMPVTCLGDGVTVVAMMFPDRVWEILCEQVGETIVCVQIIATMEEIGCWACLKTNVDGSGGTGHHDLHRNIF